VWISLEVQWRKAENKKNLAFLKFRTYFELTLKDEEMNAIEKKLGYVFRDKRLLEQALTHSSVTSDIHRNYERLEFLGDRILGVTIAEMLYHTFGDEQEGSLAQRFVTLVCKETVADVMRSLEMEKNILAANQDVKDKDNVLCDIGEALIAAIYLDSGDMSLAQQFIKRFWLPYIDKKSQPQKDYKTFLQEKAASLHLNAPVYGVCACRFLSNARLRQF